MDILELEHVGAFFQGNKTWLRLIWAAGAVLVGGWNTGGSVCGIPKKDVVRVYGWSILVVERARRSH